jgi:hypothetical protein
LRAARLFQIATSFCAWVVSRPRLALAPFLFDAQGCGPLALDPPLIEAHARNSLDAPIYDGPARSHNAKFSSGFLGKSRPVMLNLSISVDDPLRKLSVHRSNRDHE